MKGVLALTGCLILSISAAVSAHAATSDNANIVVPPISIVNPHEPVMPPGWFNPGGPNKPVSPPVVHCDCLRLVGDQAVPCCP